MNFDVLFFICINSSVWGEFICMAGRECWYVYQDDWHLLFSLGMVWLGFILYFPGYPFYFIPLS